MGIFDFDYIWELERVKLLDVNYDGVFIRGSLDYCSVVVKFF